MDTIAGKFPARRQAACLFAVSILLLLKCWSAPFLTFDDSIHIGNNPQVVGELTWGRIFLPQPLSTYFPITILSYRLDRVLFSSWMPGVLGSWAPGVRMHTWFYHAGAALLVRQILLALGVTRGRALAAGFIFALHPLACETVCWASERKNALAGFFGFAAVLCWLRLKQTRWRSPATLLLFLLALMSKPSALGLLPVFFVLEFASGRLQAGVGPAPPPSWPRRLLPLALMVLLSVFIAWLNLAGHTKTIVPPPGGSVFTALLTDVEILVRYLINVVAPVRLSFVYYVEPILSPADPRLWAYGFGLALVVALSALLAANRRRALLGWACFVLALSPHLNVVSILQLMQDRYLYLALPWLLLVIVEVSAGVEARLREHGAAALKFAAVAYIVFLAVLGFQRGGLYVNAYRLFADAVEKQPQAAHARFGLQLACAQARALAARNPHADPQALENLRLLQGEQLRAFVDKCPDCLRQPNYADMALDAGNFCLDQKDVQDAERYFRLSIDGAPQIQTAPQTLGEALCRLAGLELGRGRLEEALDLATRAAQAAPHMIDARIIRARAALSLWQQTASRVDSARAARLLDETKADLEMVPTNHPFFPEAQRLLESIQKGLSK